MTAMTVPPVTLESFEAGSLDAEAFDHEAHVYVGWLYLEHYSLHEAIGRYTAALKRLTKALGVPGKYHETITWFFLMVINERRGKMRGASWSDFRHANQDLCKGAGDVLTAYYSEDLLNSEQARSRFLLPDLPGRAA